MQPSFETLPIDKMWIDKLRELGVVEPTSIQIEAIPILCAGKDVIAQSQTGTGKTYAYLLPMLQKIDVLLKKLQVIILVPTRELGMQIIQVIEQLTIGTTLLAQPLIGGASIDRQIDKLRLHPQIVVGTPGRLLELIKVKKLSMHDVKSIVIDEADQVFSLGSATEVEAILKSVMRDRQILFFSATMPEAIQTVVQRWMKDPVYIQVDPAQRTAATLEHLYFITEAREKIDTLRRLVRLYNPKSAIVFINETDDAAEVVSKLKYVGLSMEAIYGDAEKQDRARVMNAFREGRFQLLLATDVAARGLDLTNVTHVINLDLPTDADHYVHRAGRTGRMGRQGTVISIITKKEQFIIDKFSKTLHTPFAQRAMYEGRVIDANKNDRLDKHVNSETRIRQVNIAQMEHNVRSDKRAELDTIRPPQRETTHPSKRDDNIILVNPKKVKNDRKRDLKNKGAPKWLKEKGDQPK